MRVERVLAVQDGQRFGVTLMGDAQDGRMNGLAGGEVEEELGRAEHQ